MLFRRLRVLRCRVVYAVVYAVKGGMSMSVHIMVLLIGRLVVVRNPVAEWAVISRQERLDA